MTDLADVWPEWRFSDSHVKPALLWRAFAANFDTVSELSHPATFRAALSEAYTYRNVNMGGDLSPRRWLAMFRHAGFITTGRPLPTESLTVYRGCVDWKVRAPSWTTDLDVALWFANRAPTRSVVWQAQVEPRHMLAIFDDVDEYEIVVSPFAPALWNNRLRVVERAPGAFAAGADRVAERRRRAATRGADVGLVVVDPDAQAAGQAG